MARTSGERFAVSVIIPTTGRPELLRAAQSVRNQTGDLSLELVIVFDREKGSVAVPPALAELADLIVWTGGGRRGSFARNLGVDNSSNPWVAFLDDDDEWLPDKLASQLTAAVGMHPDKTLLSCRHLHVDVDGERVSKAAPAQTISSEQKVSEYLFRKRRPTAGRASMYTSTLVCGRGLAVTVPWDDTLARHQDWDWLIRVDSVPGVKVLQVPQPLVRIQTGSSGSISASNSWTDSLAWADRRLNDQAPGVYTDFVAGQSLRYALGARSLTGVRECLRRILVSRRLPATGPLLIAAGGLLPRRTIERVLVAAR